jgi:hypothetical protein
VIGWNRFGDTIYFVLERQNGSPFQIPVWMTEPSAAGMTLRGSPRIDLAALRSLRRLLDATLPSLQARSLIDREGDDENEARTPAKSVPRADADSQPDVTRNIRTEPLKPLLQALLSDLVAAPRLAPAIRGRMDEVE